MSRERRPDNLQIDKGTLMSISRTLVAIPLLMLNGGCTLAALPYRTTQAVVDPDHGRRAEADRKLGRQIRKDEQRARRAYERCRREGRFDC